MLFLSLLFFSCLVTASPTFGSWGQANFFTFEAEQLPLRAPLQSVKATFLDGIFAKPEGHHENTIWKIISHDPKFSKLTRAIHFADAVQYFDDEDADLTFFATPDWALGHHEHQNDFGCDNLFDIDHMAEKDVASFAVTHRCHWNDVIAAVDDIDSSSLLDDKKKERRKKLLKLLVRAILAYECLPEAMDIYSLGDNNTYSTKLAIPGVLEGQPLRIRVEQKILPPSTSLNFYSKVVYPDVRASNGIIHVVNRPVLPPLPGFQTLFLFPRYFSTLTSAIQRVGLTDNVDLRFVDKDDSLDAHKIEGTSSLTFFAPVNLAFERLPPKLRLFLFSPFGHHVLRKVLEYHIVPGLVIHSDYQFNKSAHTTPDTKREHEIRHLLHGELIMDRHFRLPTLFENRTVHTHIKKVELTLPVPGPNKPKVMKTDVKVNHRHVLVPDVVTSNAAVHILDHLLDPRHHHDKGSLGESYDTSWNDWEDWLIDWANSA